MTNKPHKVDKFGYPIDPELRRLEFRLGDLAAMWRGSYDRPERQQAIMREYHQVMQSLYELGWDAELDMESHLPQEVMPAEYVKRNAGFFTYRWTSGQARLSRPADSNLDK